MGRLPQTPPLVLKARADAPYPLSFALPRFSPVYRACSGVKATLRVALARALTPCAARGVQLASGRATVPRPLA